MFPLENPTASARRRWPFRIRIESSAYLGMPRPGSLARRVWRARIEPPRRLPVPHRLRAPDLRREVAEQRQLFHLAEEMRRRALHPVGLGIVALTRIHVRLLLLV